MGRLFLPASPCLHEHGHPDGWYSWRGHDYTRAGEPFDSVAVAALKSYKFEPARDPEGNALAVMVNFDMLFEEPPPPPTTLNYRLLQRGTRKPLAGAEVVAFQDDSVLARGTSDAQGNVQLIFPAQACTVSIVAAGHEKYEITYGLEIIYDEDEEEILPLNAGESRDETLYLLRSVEEYQTIVRGRKAKREVTRRVIERDDVLKVAGTQRRCHSGHREPPRNCA